MTYMKTTVWLDGGAEVTGHDGANVAIWIGDDLTIFGTAEALGVIGEKIAEEAHRIIEERCRMLGPSDERAMAIGDRYGDEEARDVAD